MLKSVAAFSTCMFSYCVLLGTKTAEAFSQVKIPVGGVSSAAVSKTSLAATASGKHGTACPCGMCSVGRDLATARQEDSPVLGRTDGAGCPCGACSQAGRGQGCRQGCECGACAQAARASRGCGCSGACKC